MTACIPLYAAGAGDILSLGAVAASSPNPSAGGAFIRDEQSAISFLRNNR